MVPRYARPEMTAIWEPENKFKIWFEIEAHATQKLADLGVVPESAAKALWDWWATGPKIDVPAIDAIEAVTKHDVIAFLTWVAEQVGDEARFMHQGMTSSDVLDTCLAVQLAKASDILLADIDALLAAIKKRALEHKFTPTIGRSHGIHGEPVTFGLKLAQAYAEFERNRERLVAARKEIATCAISGAVGTFVSAGIEDLMDGLNDFLDDIGNQAGAASDAAIGAVLGIVEAIKKTFHLILDGLKLPAITGPVELLLDLIDNVLGNIAELVSPSAGKTAKTLRTNMYGQLAAIRSAEAARSGRSKPDERREDD